MNEQRPQLHMRRALHDLPLLSVPAGYKLRTLGPTDVESWVSLMQENNELGEWTIQKATPIFAPAASMLYQASFFVVAGDEPVATAQLNLHWEDEYAPLPELGWVAVSPRHRGRRLGALACIAVMRQAVVAGYSEVFLRTDAHRTPALQTYRRLHFVPWLRDPGAEGRWAEVERNL